MTTTRRSMLGMLAAGAVLATGEPVQAAAARPVPASLKPGGELDQLVAAMAARDEFSGTVLLTYRGRPVLSRSHGMANKQSATPNEPGTRFALASVTKLFTAVAIAQLIQQGKLSYHSKLNAYVSGFPPEITVHHLLTHTSGLGDYHQLPDFWALKPTWVSAEQVMSGITALIQPSSLAFAPGAGHAYSNSAYHLLGEIVARVSGQSYHDYVREHIFAAADMRSTDFYTRIQAQDDPRIARPYNKLPSGERVDILSQRLFIGTPAGDAISSCGDLDRFGAALLGEKLLNRAFTQITLNGKLPMPPLQGPRPPVESPGTRVAAAFQCYGPIALLDNNQWAIGHGGGSPGASTSIDVYPDSGWTAVILSNYDMGTVQPIAGLARRLIVGTR